MKGHRVRGLSGRQTLHCAPRFERLEDRSLLTAAHVYQAFSGAIAAPGGEQTFAIAIDADVFTPSGRSVLLGMHVRAADGRSLDPAAVQINRAAGGTVAGEYVAANLAGGRESLVLAELSPDAYELIVRGDGISIGAFSLDVFLVGDANGDQSLTRADVARFAKGYGATVASSEYQPEADANLDGQVSLADLALLKRNFGVAIQHGSFSVTEISPADGEELVNLTRETIVRFSEPVDPATVTAASFYLIAKGERVPGRVVVSSTDLFATLFYDALLPASTEVRVVVDGNLIRSGDGAYLDGDGDGVGGGVATADFRTLPLTRIPGTNIFGYVYDSYHTNPDGSNIPVVGATIRVDALPEANTTTDAAGFFILRDMPAPEFFVHIDGTTAINAPPGTIYPSVGKPFHVVPGQEVQLSMMGTPFNIYLPPMAAADVVTLSPTEDTPVGFGEAGLEELAVMFPELDPSVWDRLRVTFPAGSAVDNQGNPATQAVVIPVPPDRIPAPLPPFVDPKLVISIQAIGAENFDVPAPLTFPNLDGLAPGEKSLILSFDHDAGRWKSIGSGTVSNDGLTIASDPGVGVLAPGWHINNPGGNNNGNSPNSGPMCNSAGTDTEFITAEMASDIMFPPTMAPPAGGDIKKIRVRMTTDGPIGDFLKPSAVAMGERNLAGTGTSVAASQTFTLNAGDTTQLVFKATPKTYDDIYGVGNFKNELRDRMYATRVTVRKDQINDRGRIVGCSIERHFIYRWIDVIDAQVVQARQGSTAVFHRTFVDGERGFVREKRVDLRLPNQFDTTFTGSNAVFNYAGPYRGNQMAVWKFDPTAAGNLDDVVSVKADGVVVGDLLAEGKATVPTTINVNIAGFKQELKCVVLALKDTWIAGPDGKPGFVGDDDGVGAAENNTEYGWTDPGFDGILGNADDLHSDDIMEVLVDYTDGSPPPATGCAPRLAGVIVPTALQGGFENVLNFTIPGGWRTYLGKDGMVGGTGADQDHTFLAAALASTDFKMLFAGFMPSDRLDPGPNGAVGDIDDQFTSTQLSLLDAKVELVASQLKAAVLSKYAPINGTLSAYQFVDTGGNVTMDWQDQYFPDGTVTTGYVVNGAADGDYGKSFLCPLQADFTLPSTAADCPLLADPDLPIGAKMWALAQGINPSLMNSGGFAVANRIRASTAADFVNRIAKTVAHEVAHTFGIVDAYTIQSASPGGATAGCDATRNCIPFDIMKRGDPLSNTVQFLPQNVELLHAALGLHPNTEDALKNALTQYRKTFNLANNEIGIEEDGIDVVLGQVAPPPPPAVPRISALVNGMAYFGFDDGGPTDFGTALADGSGGSTATLQFDLVNVGNAPLAIDSMALANDTAGFAVITPGVTGTSLAPDERVTVQVAFDPVALGDFADILTIGTNTADMPLLEIPLVGTAKSPNPVALVTPSGTNHIRAGGLGFGFGKLAQVTNDGGEPLVISELRVVEGANEFIVQAFDADGDRFTTRPFAVEPGETIDLRVEFDASKAGLARAIIEMVTNDPARPIVRLGASGTLPQRVEVGSGNDFVVVQVEDSPPLRTISDSIGGFNFILPPARPYLLSIFDPDTGMIATGEGITAAQGETGDISEGLTFDSAEGADSDFDGLPDDIEFAIGTGPTLFDTDHDGIDDFAEIEQGLDPLDGRAFPTGIIAALTLPGESNAVVVEGDTAYVVTGTHGLAIIDFSRFDNPILLGQLNLPGNALDVAVDSSLAIAVVASQEGGLHLVDVFDPMLPVLRESLSLEATQVDVADGVAYVTQDETLHAIDLVTGEDLQSLVLPGSGVVRGLAREGTRLYALVKGSDTFSVIDIANEGLANVLGQMSLPAGSFDMGLFVGNGVAFLASADLTKIDVSDPSSLSIVSAVPFVGARGVALNGSGLALVASRTLGLNVYDATSADLQTAFLFGVNTPGEARSVAVASGVALVADGPSGLEVINYLAFDSAGQVPSVSISTSAADASPATPGVQVVEGSTIPIRADVFDDVQIRSVELLVNGVVAQTDVSFPFDFFALAVDDGSAALRLQLRAIDTGGNSALSSELVLGLVPDTVPPTIVSIDPADGSVFSQEEGRQTVRVVFSEPLAAGTVNSTNFRLFDSAAATVVPLDVQLRGNDRLVQLTYPPFGPGPFEFILDQLAVTDRAGNALESGQLVTEFTVLADVTPPAILSIAPGDGSVADEGLNLVEVRFSEPMDAATLTLQSIQLRTVGDSVILPITTPFLLDDDQRVRLSFAPLSAGGYELVLNAPAITDRAGLPLGDTPITSRFTLEDARGALFAGQFFPTGMNPRQVATGDFNGDGFPDVVTAAFFGSVSILLGFGDGTLASATDYVTNRQLGELVLGDINNDTNLDVVVAGSSDVSVLRGLGDGTLSPAQLFPAGSGGIEAAALGDVDGDGDLDVVVGTQTSGIKVLPGNGDGTFGARRDVAAPQNLAAVTLGDLDGDGDLDIVAASQNATSVFTLSGNGDGTFAAAVEIPVQFTPEALALGDLDADGDLDLAIGNACVGQLGGPGCVSLMLGNGDGTFASRTDFLVAGAPQDLVLNDMDRDGDLDIVTANTSTRMISVLEGLGVGSFGRRRDVTAPGGSVAVADLDSDGIADLVSPEQFSIHSVLVIRGSSNGSFAVDPPLSVGTGAKSVVLADLDEDGDLDAITPNNQFPGGVSIVWNSGAGFEPFDQPFGTGARTMAVSDVNGDGRPDLVSASDSQFGFVSVRLGNGDGTLGGPTDTAIDGNARDIVLADLNADGDLDVVTGHVGTTSGTAGVSVLLGDGTGRLAAATKIGGTAVDRFSVAVGDLNGDGRADIVTTNSSNLSLFAGNGDGTFAPPANFGSASSPRFVRLADVDADSDLDVVTSSGNSMIVIPGNGNGTFGTQRSTSLGFTPSSAVVGDVDGVNGVDVVLGNSSGGSLALQRNDGGGNFSGSAVSLSALGSQIVRMADMDADGDLDIVAAWKEFSSSRSTTSVLLGNGNGTFAAQTDFLAADDVQSLALADLDGNGAVDILAGGFDRLATLLGTDGGTFGVRRADLLFTDRSPAAVVVGDFNGDDNLDIVAHKPFLFPDGEVSVLLGNGIGGFGVAADFIVTGESRSGLSPGDFDADGDLDLLLGGFDETPVSVLLNAGNGTFATQIDLGPTINNRTVPLAVGDVNGDDDLDIVVATINPADFQPALNVYLGGPGATFAPAIDVVVGGFANIVALALGDVDGDTKLDIAVGRDFDTIALLLGSGNGIFGSRIDTAESQQAIDLELADLDGDSDLDIVAGLANVGAVSMFLNSGDGSFGSRTDFAVDGNPQSLALGDIDADADLDLVVANSAFTSVNFDLVSVLLNRRFLILAPSPQPSDSSAAEVVVADPVVAAPAQRRPGLGPLVARHVDHVLVEHANLARIHLPAARRDPADLALRTQESHDAPTARRTLRASRQRRHIANIAADMLLAQDQVTGSHDA